MPSRIATALVLVVGAALACSPAVQPNRVASYDLDDPELSPPPSENGAHSRAAEPAARPPKARWGSVDRAELLRVLDAGPAAFLSGIKLQPFFRDQRFAGWEIVSFWPRDSRYAAVDLQPGDVISAVNGRKIMKPNQLFDEWSKLRDASVIVVTGTRANEPFELRFQVIGGPPPSDP